jgi:hypothetical protein
MSRTGGVGVPAFSGFVRSGSSAYPAMPRVTTPFSIHRVNLVGRKSRVNAVRPANRRNRPLPGGFDRLPFGQSDQGRRNRPRPVRLPLHFDNCLACSYDVQLLLVAKRTARCRWLGGHGRRGARGARPASTMLSDDATSTDQGHPSLVRGALGHLIVGPASGSSSVADPGRLDALLSDIRHSLVTLACHLAAKMIKSLLNT